MSQVFYMVHDMARMRAYKAVEQAEHGDRVTISKPKRSSAQNDKFHAICTDLERSKFPFAGKPRTKEQWKVLLVSGHATATKEGAEIIPGIEGEFVNIRESTAAMSKARGSSLIEYAIAYCVSNDVPLREYRHLEAA